MEPSGMIDNVLLYRIKVFCLFYAFSRVFKWRGHRTVFFDFGQDVEKIWSKPGPGGFKSGTRSPLKGGDQNNVKPGWQWFLESGLFLSQLISTLIIPILKVGVAKHNFRHLTTTWNQKLSARGSVAGTQSDARGSGQTRDPRCAGVIHMSVWMWEESVEGLE